MPSVALFISGNPNTSLLPMPSRVMNPAASRAAKFRKRVLRVCPVFRMSSAIPRGGVLMVVALRHDTRAQYTTQADVGTDGAIASNSRWYNRPHPSERASPATRQRLNPSPSLLLASFPLATFHVGEVAATVANLRPPTLRHRLNHLDRLPRPTWQQVSPEE